MKKDLTQGSIPRQLISLSLPTMLAFMAQVLYDLVDMMWIGRINGEAVAGVAIFSSVFWIVEVLNEVVGSSSISLISQSYGTRDMKRTATVIEQTLVFKALMAFLAAVILLLFLKPLIIFFSKDAAVIQYALDYGYLRIFFLPIFFSSFTVNTALRCSGDAKSPMIIMFITFLVNILLDPLLMFKTIPGTSLPGLGLGVFGAALATVISFTLAFLMGFTLIFSGRGAVRPRLKGLLTLNRKIDVQLLTIGLPNGFESFTRQFAVLVILKFASWFGTSAQAVLGIGFRLFGFVFIPLIGLLLGGSPMVGQNLGAEKVDRAVKTSHWSLFFSCLAMGVFSLGALVFAPQIISVFINQREVIEIGIPMIRITALGFIPLGIAFGLGVVFPGAGDNLPFFIASAAGKWGIQIPFLFIALYFFSRRIEILWISFVLSDSVEALAVFYFYKRGKWKGVRV